MRHLVMVMIATLIALPARSSAQTGDSVRTTHRPSVVTWWDAAVMGAGIAGSIATMGVDSRVARRLQEDRYQGNSRYSRIADAAAQVNEKSLFAAGLVTWGIARLVHAPRTTTDIAWHTTESIFIASATPFPPT